MAYEIYKEDSEQDVYHQDLIQSLFYPKPVNFLKHQISVDKSKDLTCLQNLCTVDFLKAPYSSRIDIFDPRKV